MATLQQTQLDRFTLTYSKCSNRKLFASLADMKIASPQNYNPFYQRFFALGAGNANSVCLNQPYSLQSVLAKITPGENTYSAVVTKKNATPEEVSVFFKYSPLLDPLKYLSGKYDITNPALMQLPTFGEEGTASSANKILDSNNMSYVDAFFTYLCSQLRHHHQFVHGIDFYGSFLAMKTDFAVNVYDDLEFLQESSFFMENRNKLFRFDDDTAASGLLNRTTRNRKSKLQLDNEGSDGGQTVILELSDITDLLQLDQLFLSPASSNSPSAAMEEVTLTEELGGSLLCKGSSSKSSNSNCSSRTSYTTEDEPGDENDGDDNDKDDGDDDLMSEGSTSEESLDTNETVLARINSFPVQVIALERCTATLDALLMEKGETISEMEWSAIVTQILISLITFQKCFDLTHNDLHTNNIMYTPTEEKFLYYKVNNILYKVPTYGRLFKIIDFGRAIYRFRGQQMCSDSYRPEGDAYTQYNCEPFRNPLKPRIDPNPSFDLCRLGCALFDFLVDDLKDIKRLCKTSAIKKIMLNWCNDDQGRNVLYKSNGDERYPDFKLYKMIARTVHNHTPLKVFQSACFQQFRVAAKKVKNVPAEQIMNIDAYPSYQE